ncbi:SDR family oxidoreductase, partial [Cellulomonas biazotea]|uniref:SDR family oxidoreductase n=1 Tax=Cellulomonas biazotea TaxID=1709 RepID=UPI0027D9B94C
PGLAGPGPGSGRRLGRPVARRRARVGGPPVVAGAAAPKEPPLRVPDQSGRSVVVTGGNSGIGREAAERLAAAGARVVLTARDEAKGAAAVEEIRSAHPGADVELRLLDLADLASVAAFADGLARDLPHLDALLNNAGVMAPPTRFETVDGFELQMGTNVLGPLALTNRLLPLLLAASAPRVVWTSSGVAHLGRIRFDDLQARRRYRPWAAYAQSKLADLLLGRHLAHVADERGWPLLSVVTHPGFTRTNLQTAGASLGGGTPRRSPFGSRSPIPSMEPAEGALSLLLAATGPDVAQGGYLGPTGTFGIVGPPGPVRLSRRMRDDATAARLWHVAEDLTGTSLPSA